jgi:hypothetical protein
MYRPRDFVAIINKLNHKTKFETESFRREVNEHSHQEIGTNLFAENSVFLRCLKDKSQRENFLSLIPYNVLDKITVRKVCSEYNGTDGSCVQEKCNPDENCSHPFSELYNMGLLGYVDRDQKDRQHFKKPEEIKNFENRDLIPDNTHYLIHPCLNDYIKALKKTSDNRYIIPFISVETDKQWTKDDTNAFNLFEMLSSKNEQEKTETYTELQKMKLKDRKINPHNIDIHIDNTATVEFTIKFCMDFN